MAKLHLSATLQERERKNAVTGKKKREAFCGPKESAFAARVNNWKHAASKQTAQKGK